MLAASHKRPVELEHFVGLIKRFCATCRIETTMEHGKIYLVGVRLARPKADERLLARPLG
jgi:hypothetical protein